MKKVIDLIANIYSWIALIIFIVLFVLLSIEVISRILFQYSFVWSQELVSILVSWVIFLGFGKVVVDKEDIHITFFVKKLSSPYKRLVAILNSIFLLITSAAFLYFSLTLSIAHMNRTTLIMKISSSLYYYPLVLLFILIVLVSIHQLVRSIKGDIDLFEDTEEVK